MSENQATKKPEYRNFEFIYETFDNEGYLASTSESSSELYSKEDGSVEDSKDDSTADEHMHDDNENVGYDSAWLRWAPRNHPSHIYPQLRYEVETAEGDFVVKYLTLHQDEGFGRKGFKYTPQFFDSQEYKDAEPLRIKSGNWNMGHLDFYQDRRGEILSKDYDHELKKPEQLPQLPKEAIWPEDEKPRIEYLELLTAQSELDTRLGCLNEIVVVMHVGIGPFGNKNLAMKVWPTPQVVHLGIETEMEAYKACEGKEITPEFLAHVTENGRVIGFLMEYIEGAHIPQNAQEKELCRDAVKRLYNLTGWLRSERENRKGNFLVRDGKVWIIDLSRALRPEQVKSRGDDWVHHTIMNQFDTFWEFPPEIHST